MADLVQTHHIIPKAVDDRLINALTSRGLFDMEGRRQQGQTACKGGLVPQL